MSADREVESVEATEHLVNPADGAPAEDLADEDLYRELFELHRTRNDTLRHGSDQALGTHTERTTELEHEYLRRFPQREIDPMRMRP